MLSVRSTLAEAAAELSEVARKTALSAEQNRRVDPSFIAKLKASGVAGMGLPQSIGGTGGDLSELLDVVKTIARGDGSAGWVAMIYASSGLAAHYMEPAGLAEVFADGTSTLSSGVLAPRGVARQEAEGFVLSGRWPFASGCLDASWISLGAMVETGEASTPYHVYLYLPIEQVEILDTWDVIGLRATASHDVAVNEQWVPASRRFDLSAAPSTQDLIARYPIHGLLAAGIGAVSLGIGQAAIDEAAELAGVKVPTGSKRRLIDRPAFQEALARAESLVSAGSFYLMGQASRSETRATPNDRARLRMAATHAVEAAEKAVDLMYRAAGGSSVYYRSSLQRHMRDIHTATQHMMVAQPTWELAGRVLAGIESDLTGL